MQNRHFFLFWWSSVRDQTTKHISFLFITFNLFLNALSTCNGAYYENKFYDHQVISRLISFHVLASERADHLQNYPCTLYMFTTIHYPEFPNSTTEGIRIPLPWGSEFHYPEDLNSTSLRFQISLPSESEFHYPENPNSATLRSRIPLPWGSEFHYPENPNSTTLRFRISLPWESVFHYPEDLNMFLTDLSGSDQRVL